MIAWIFGDSFVDKHFPDGNKKSWADILLENKGYKVNNFAKAGRSTDDAVFCLRDMLDKIDPEKDYVLFTLSNASRYMTIENIETNYINTSRHNVDIWQVWTKDYKGDIDILNAMMKLGNDYSNRLKLSIHSNYVKRLLDDIGVKYKMICGHFEFIEEQSDIVKKYMLKSEQRILPPEIMQYYDTESYIKFNAGYCLINDFFHFQIDKLLKSDNPKKQKLQDHFNQWVIEEKKTPWKYAEVGAKFIHRLNQTQSDDEDVFFDTWHLSTNGHKQYAKYAEQYDWGI